MSTGYNQLQIEEESKVDGSLDMQVLSSPQMKMQRTDSTEVHARFIKTTARKKKKSRIDRSDLFDWLIYFINSYSSP